MTRNFILKAGKNALVSIRDSGFDPNKIRIIAGAAGGPKWLVLSQLDRLMLSSWLAESAQTIQLIGASIGAWRFAAFSRNNPIEALSALEEFYIAQSYTGRPSPREVTAEADRILNAYISDTAINEILKNPVLKLNVLTDQCKGLCASENKLRLYTGLLTAASLNLIRRQWLNLLLERTVFHTDDSGLFAWETSTFDTRRVELTGANLKTALMASGAIPTVMEGIEFANEPSGVFRDGGLIDYHLDLPYRVPNEDDIVLFPHFSERIIPGWLDKKLRWRGPDPENLKNVLLIAPSGDFIKSLPNNKIPDRGDFKYFFGKDKERIHVWKTVAQMCTEFAEDVMDALSSSKSREIVQPI